MNINPNLKIARRLHCCCKRLFLQALAQDDYNNPIFQCTEEELQVGFQIKRSLGGCVGLRDVCHSFWGKKITPKKCICDICYFATKKPRWFELGLNQWKALVFHTLLFISTICTHILSWVFTIVPKFTPIVHLIKQKVRKLFRKSIHFRVVFWKNYDTRKFFFTTVSRDGRDKSHVHVCD